MSKLSMGVIPIILGADREEFQLKASVRAVLGVSDLDGGLTNVLVRIQKMDFRTYVAVVRIGLSADDKLSKRLNDLVFETGLLTLMEPLVKFVTLLMNGGKDPKDKEEGEGDQGNAGAADAA